MLKRFFVLMSVAAFVCGCDDGDAPASDDMSVEDASDSSPSDQSDDQSGDSDVDPSDLTDDVSSDASDLSDALVPDADVGSQNICGNGTVEPSEACDDGNTDSDDWCSADCQMLVDVTTPSVVPGHNSWGTLTSSNGLAALTYSVRDLNDNLVYKVDRFMEHVYADYDKDTQTWDYLWDLLVGYRASGDAESGHWLSEVPPDEVRYVEGTGVIRTAQVTDGLRIENHYFVPYHHPTEDENSSRYLVTVMRVENVSGAAITGAEIYSLFNVHIGGQGDAWNETVAHRTVNDYLVEYRGDTRFLYQNLVSEGASFSADNAGEPNNPWILVSAGAGFAGFVDPAMGHDLAIGFSNTLGTGGTLANGEVGWYGAVATYGVDVSEDDLYLEMTDFIGGRGPEQILNAEVLWWQSWHNPTSLPDGLTTDEARIYRQSTAILKMCQVRETDATGCPSNLCGGQILASLPPGQWHISWVRDASYAILALVESGHLDEAGDALQFMLDAEMRRENDANYYQTSFIESSDPSGGVWGLGVDLAEDYRISVARYFGSGIEESDENDAGPNIEWDNWGLFLWALGRYVEATGDTDFYASEWRSIRLQIAELLLQLVNPSNGLLFPDSSIWERHWCPHEHCAEPETRKHHTYSSIMAAQGLAWASFLASELGDTMNRDRYAEGAAAIRTAIVDRLIAVPPGTLLPALAGNLEELPFEVFYLDLAAVEAINTDVLHPGSPEAFGTIAAFDQYLRVGVHSPGYMRNDDPTWYDRQEWVMVDLRAASALVRMGQTNRARSLIDWITDQANHNSDIIPELLSDGVYQAGSEDDRWQRGIDNGGDYQGAIPMCGFGPGAWILAIHDLYGD